MKLNFLIREIKTKEEMISLFPLLKELTPRLKKTEYKQMLSEMLSHGYRMAGAFDGNKCAGLSGFWISTKIYCGKYVELDNVVVSKNYRSKGIGKLLSEWILKEAETLKCKVAMLDAYLENTAAHNFYEREGFEAKGFHFIKNLDY